ncbi:MAG: CARDB domain-containing protein [Gammaproteobacteria bacterium]
MYYGILSTLSEVCSKSTFMVRGLLVTAVSLTLVACSSGGGGGGGSTMIITPPADSWDFQVTVAAVPSSVVVGGSLTLDATVSNASSATLASPASTLTWYQSSDATLDTASDTTLDTDDVPGLDVGGSISASYSATAPSTAGTYTYFACMPTTGSEANASDNCGSVAVVVSAGQWDFQVAVSANPSSVVVGSSLTLDATVSNTSTATASSSASTLTWYQSSDATLDTATDTELDTDDVSGLAIGGDTSASYSATAPSTAGTYTYFACMPTTGSEANASDNCGSVAVVVSAGQWDFQVAITADPSTVVVGGALTLDATVSNASTATAPSTASTLTWYQSSDGTLDTATDTELDTDDVSGLAIGGNTSASYSATAPSTAGTYTYFACMPTTGSEVNAGDNCGTVAVVVSPGQWDFQVSITADPSTIVVGGDLTLNATVSNAASATAGSLDSTLTWYQSSDSTLDTATDSALNTDDVSGLAIGGNTSASYSATAPATAGTYTYFACMPTTGSEANASDNCGSVAVEVLPSQWDFQVALSATPSSVVVGNALTLNATVSNAGNATIASNASTLTWYQSSDATLDTATDTELRADSVSQLAVGSGAAASYSATAPSTAGTYTYFACMPTTGSEANASDNCGSVAVVVSPGQWDFQVAITADPSSVVVGGALTLDATVSNASTATTASSDSTLTWYQSSDATLDTATDAELDTDDVSGLAIGGNTSASYSATAPSTAGTYTYFACMPTTGSEANANDNCDSVAVEVLPSQWDFQVAITADPSTVVVAGVLTLNAKVSNAGSTTIASSASTLTWYQSADATLDTATDTALRSDAVSGLAIGGDTSASYSATAPSTAGTYTYFACMPTTGSEANASDNCGSVAVEVLPSQWDFQVTLSATPSTVVVAGALTLNATVSNAGSATIASSDSTLTWYQSSDSTLDTATDTALRSDAVSGLAIGGNTSASYSATAPSTAGTYTYFACMPTTGSEANTSDNCGSVAVVVSPGQWDYQVAVTANPSSVVVGNALTLNATVKNASTATIISTASTLTWYQSSDATLDTATDTALRSDAVSQVAIGGSISASYSATAPSTAGTYTYFACMPTTGSEANANDNCGSVAVVVSTGQWDFHVTVAATPSSVAVGNALTLDATVSNASTATAPSTASTLTWYQSSDATLDVATDTELDTDDIPGLAVSSGAAASYSATAPSTPGTYTYFACMPTTGSEANANDNCGSVAVVVTAVWDFQVTAAANPPSVVVGGSLSLNAIVSNASTATEPTPASTLTWYQSSDSTLDVANDTQVGTVAVSELAIGGNTGTTYPATAPPTAGTYTYFGCMPTTEDEGNASDNCGSVAVVVSPSQWDFQVAVSATPSIVVVGNALTLDATVSNASTATAPSTASTLTWYQSSDSTLDAATDTALRTDAVSALAIGGNTSASYSATASATAGTFTYFACMATTGAEANANDNCGSVAVVVLPSQWDFQVSVAANPSSVVVDSTFLLNATVINASTATVNSPVSTLTWYQSSDGTLDTVIDTKLDDADIHALVPGHNINTGYSATAPSIVGTYTYFACVPTSGDEVNASDNCGSVAVEVVPSQWDFQVVLTANKSSVVVGNALTLTAAVSNGSSATVPGPATTLTWYQSSDGTLDAATDTELDTDDVSELAIGGNTSVSYSATAPSTAGTYTYFACMPTSGDEVNLSDNCDSVAVVVSLGQWDFQVVVEADPSSVVVGNAVTLTATVDNASSATIASTASTLTWYQSSDGTLDTATDTALRADAVSQLAIGGSTSASYSATAPSTAGTYTYFACMPTTGSEANTSDNCGSVAVVVSGGQWDFSVTLLASSSSVVVGDALTLTATVNNASSATVASSASTLTWYQSTDPALNIATDTALDTDAVSSLAIGGNTSVSYSATAPSTAGTYTYFACMPTTGDEANANDNCGSVAVVVSAGQWDFSVALTATPASSTTDQLFTLDAVVSNASSATASSPAQGLHYYQSSDATLDVDTDIELGTDLVPVLEAGTDVDAYVNVTAPSTAGTYTYFACMPTAGSEANASDNCDSVDVVVTLSQWNFSMALASTAAVIGPESIFTLTATISNTGAADTPQTAVTFYRSPDETLDLFTDVFLDTQLVPVVTAGANTTVSIVTESPAVLGVYTYFACVPATGSEADASDNCHYVDVDVSGGWDFQVSMEASDTTPAVGDTIDLTIEVRNGADATAATPANSILTLYVSTDATLDAEDFVLSSGAIPSLAPNGSYPAPGSIDITGSLSAYFFACMPTSGYEINAEDNCAYVLVETQ